MKKYICLFISLLLLISVLPLSVSAAGDKYIDNSDLMPVYKPSAEVDQIQNGNLWSPDWVKDLIIAELRIETATPEGTFQAAVKVLDHYREMGVNCLWITPIYDRSGTDPRSNGYGNYGPDTVWSRLTGKDTYEESWAVVKEFVDQAHKRNIRILFDVVTWGTDKKAPLYESNPEYYQVGYSVWGGWAFNWSGLKFKEWMNKQCVELILRTGADGFRCDLEPDITGYNLFTGVRDTLEFTHGVKIAIMSEIPNTRETVYDIEQFGVGVDETSENHYTYYRKYFTEKMNIVDACKTGRGIGSQVQQLAGAGGTNTYYTYCLANHDNHDNVHRGNRVSFGYEAIFAPFIPLWYIGTEWNNTWSGMCFTDTINWDLLDDNAACRAFYEDVKQMIRIRRTYADIFSYWPTNHRETNICKVEVNGSKDAIGDAYARYANGKGFVIVANQDGDTLTANVKAPLADMGIPEIKNATYTVTEMMTGKRIKTGTFADIAAFAADIPAKSVAAFYIDYTLPATTATTTTTTTTKPTATTAATTQSTVPTTEDTQPTTVPTTESTAPTTAADSTPDADDTANAPIGWIIGITAAVLVVIGAVVVLMLLKKKKA